MKKILITAALYLLMAGAGPTQPKPAAAASYTVTIPNNILTDVIDAIAYQHGYLDNVVDPDNPSQTIPNPESKIAFAKRMNRRWIRLNVKAWEQEQAGNAAREQAIKDANTKTETIEVQ